MRMWAGDDWAQALAAQARALDSVRFADMHVQQVAQVDSTNSALMRLAQLADGREPLVPQVLWAQTQTCGRGRMGRVWHVSPGQTLCFSVALPFAPQDWQGLSLVVGLALAEALMEDYDLVLQLKWPNDVYVQGQKLAGVLLETASLPAAQQVHYSGRWLVVGIGLNVQGAPQADVRTPASYLAAHTKAPLAAQTLLLQVLARLWPALLHFERAGFAPFAAQYAARDFLQGKAVNAYQDAQLQYSGVGAGVNSQGAYVLHTPTGTCVVQGEELSLRV